MSPSELAHSIRALFLRRRFAGFTRLLPPLAVDAAKYALSEWNYQPGGWRADGLSGGGWNHESVAAAQEKHWPVLVRNLEGTGPLGVSHLPSQMAREDCADHNAMMSYGYVLAQAARNKDRLSILDWGGGAGHYYLYSQALLPELALDYHCYEVPSLCRVGRRLLPGVQFHEGADKLAGTQFDLVISSSSLHYFEDWRETARVLAGHTGGFLYVARLQTVNRAPSFVVKQCPRSQGYNTEYLSWFLNRGELIDCAGRLGLELVREFVFGESWMVRRAPEKGECRGFLFRRRRAGVKA
jgi:putative methyltransferase (TIGR04325 family)